MNTMTTEPDRTSMSREQLESALAQREDQLRHVEAQCAGMREALEFYGDPETYFAIAILPDPPCGEFADDYSETNTDLGVRHGKKAREALSTDFGKSILERLETARDLLSRCPGIRTDETQPYWDEVQAFLGREA